MKREHDLSSFKNQLVDPERIKHGLVGDFSWLATVLTFPFSAFTLLVV